jgi:5,5'-dehydrodivanillate O-demethylase
MGRLLRTFWHPVSTADAVVKGKARSIRIMGEDLTLYRGESGKPYLVSGWCAHRLTRLHTGWVEGEEVRCIYHGWKYDGTGQCTQMPAEKPGLEKTVKISAYPVREYGGFIFGYLGENEAPEFVLPRKEVAERSDRMIFARQQKWPCNWLQTVENSLDAVHVSFVHQKGKIGPFGKAVTSALPALEYIETDAGIRQTATRGPGNVRISDWTFPNNNHIIVPSAFKEDPWLDLIIWMVPNDDHHTTRFQLYSVPRMDDARNKRIRDHFQKYSSYNPTDHHDDLFNDIYPDEPLFELTNAQDYVAAIGQGPIANRIDERLGASDSGVALLRRIYIREMEALRSGSAQKVWRPLDEPEALPVQGVA